MGRSVTAREVREWIPIVVTLGIGYKVGDMLGFWRGPREEGPPKPKPEGADGKPQTPTLSEATARSVADTIAAAFFDFWGEDEAAMADALLRCKNDADVWLVDKAFGLRESPYLLDPGAYTMAQAFVWGLSSSQRAALNAKMRAKGITWQI